jgi:hypothetical protein
VLQWACKSSDSFLTFIFYLISCQLYEYLFTFYINQLSYPNTITKVFSILYISYIFVFFHISLRGLLSGLLHRTIVRDVKTLMVKSPVSARQTDSMDSIDQNSCRLRLAYSTFQTNSSSPDTTRACSKVGSSKDRSRDGFGLPTSLCLFVPNPGLPSCLCINSSCFGRVTLATPFW